jgi:Flp pilus assembly pilin Flp
MLHIISNTFRKLGLDEKGASAVEYAILVGVIGAVLATGARAFALDLSGVFSNMIDTINFTGTAS